MDSPTWRPIYICHPPAIWSSLETWDIPHTPKNISKPSKCTLIKFLDLAQALWVLVLGLALEKSERARCWALWAGSRVNHHCILVRRPPWSLGGSSARQWPSDLVWSGVDNFVRGKWRPPHPSWWSSLVESGIKVTVIVFTKETWLPKAILFVSASTTWMLMWLCG